MTLFGYSSDLHISILRVEAKELVRGCITSPKLYSEYLVLGLNITIHIVSLASTLNV